MGYTDGVFYKKNAKGFVIRMNSRMKTIWINILGWTFLVLGILGFFLPFLQGILFTLIGLYLLSKTSPWAKRLLDRLRERYPKMAAKSDAWIGKFRWKSNSTPE
jgi:hypothetical protein